MSVFDPFGFLADKMVTAKILLKQTWSQGIDWDEELPRDLAVKFQSLLDAMHSISSFRVPRCHSLLLPFAIDLQLHIFTDASENAMAAVSFWRIETSTKVEVSFVFGKSRTAPKKMTTIPRLELEAAVLGSRMKETIETQYSIKPKQCFIWTDSRTVFLWINSEARKYKPYVMHRIAEIIDNLQGAECRWLPTDLNPADEGTREKEPIRFGTLTPWIQGPAFLLNASSEWPTNPNNLQTYEVTEEVKQSPVQMLLISPSEVCLMPLLSRFSKYYRLLRATAWVKRAAEMFRKRGKKGELKILEIDTAERFLCRMVQLEVYPCEIAALEKGQMVETTSDIWRLSPTLDTDKLLRCQGRIDAADIIPWATRRPIILPNKHYFTDLVIDYFHRQLQHQ